MRVSSKQTSFVRNWKSYQLPYKYSPQGKASKCYECNTPFTDKTLKVLWKDCCECSCCGKFIIMDIKNMKYLGVWK